MSKSGASLAQIYTCLIYQGPKIIHKIKVFLSKINQFKIPVITI